jgi:hypothetical protein
MVRCGLALLAALIWFTTDASAQAQKPLPTPFDSMFQGTPEEQAACRPDSTRYCRDAEPNALMVLACLQRNRTKISTPCRKVLESHGQ